ncbi:hypothetical protein CCYA_CCYA18G4539 [Cyanidiococcus yangmingshanensis]|nr:hypothetical protein CCYA_CCYA18G4539 [Cyanidiococcus yangmingshanensis]
MTENVPRELSPQKVARETTPESFPTTPGLEQGRNPFDDDDVDRMTADIDESEIEAQKKIWDSRRAALANSGGRDRKEQVNTSEASPELESACRSAGRTPAWTMADSIQLTPKNLKNFSGAEQDGNIGNAQSVRQSPPFELSVAEAPEVVTNLSTTFEGAQAPGRVVEEPTEPPTGANVSQDFTHDLTADSELKPEMPPTLTWDHIPSRIIRDTITSLETQVSQYEKELIVAQDLVGTLKNALSTEQVNRQRHVTKIAELEAQIQQLEEEGRRKSLRIASLEKECEQQGSMIERLRDELVQAQRWSSSIHETEAYTDILAKLRETMEQLDTVRLERDLLEKRLNGSPLDSYAASQMNSVCSTGKENETTDERQRIPAQRRAEESTKSVLRPKQATSQSADGSLVPEAEPVAPAEQSVVKQHVQKFDRLNTSSLLDGHRTSDKRIMRFTDWLGTGKLSDSKSDLRS